jgi:response regulator RpfG family c-di-GMP phosphodiesterase
MSLQSTAPVTVLVVDEDRRQRLVVERALTESGYQVITATSAEEGLSAAERHRPALIISEYVMPGMDGFAFCRTVRTHPALAHTIFVLHTTSADPARHIAGLDTGADDYLTKPVNVDELRSRIRALLRTKSLHDELRRQRAELARAHEAMSQNFSGVVTLLHHLIGHRVPGALERGDRAAALARWVGGRGEMTESELGALELAARIHEIGKLDLSDKLLGKPASALTAEERDAIGQFPLVGSGLVERIPQLEPIAVLIRHQLENYDGTGVPDHLKGAQIPVGARILRLVNLLESEEVQGLRGDALVRFVEDAQGTVLGPRMGRLGVEYVQRALDADWAAGKVRVDLDELVPGMTIAVDLCTGRGTKLLPKDSVLTRATIGRIKTFHQVDPILDDIFVHSAPAAAGA